jgi:tripartite-type tricarboxylate transporter receptor subunit TctC
MRNHRFWKLVTLLWLSTGVVLLGFTAGQEEKPYPSRNVQIIVPAGTGGGLDTTVRFMKPLLEKELGVSVLVVNVPGGAHTKGIVFAKSQPADGYTILIDSPSALIADIFNKMPFKFSEEFVPLARIQQDTGILWTGKNGRFKVISEMIDFAKKNPGKVTVAITTPGGVDEAAVGTFARLAGIELSLVPIESGGERMASIIANHIDLMYEEASGVGDMVKSGDVRPLVIFRDTRVNTPELEGTPAAGELGIKGMDSLGTWRGFAVLKETPKPIQDRLVAVLKKI